MWLRPLLAAATFVLLIAAPLYIYVRPAFVELQYARAGFPASERFDAAERTRLSRVLVDYLRHRTSDDDLAALQTDEGQPALIASELSHMRDVRRVMDGFFWAAPIAVAFLSIAAILLRRHSRLDVFTAGLRAGALAILALMGLILVSAAVNFDRFFDLFHRLFFESGTWVFYYQDTLIQLYPTPLWVTAVTAVAVTILFEAAIVWLVSGWVNGQLEKRT